LPPAARGALFEKTAPLDPPQKIFIKGCFNRHLSSVTHLLIFLLSKSEKFACLLPRVSALFPPFDM
jgi:hypothetical protein